MLSMLDAKWSERGAVFLSNSVLRTMIPAGYMYNNEIESFRASLVFIPLGILCCCSYLAGGKLEV